MNRLFIVAVLLGMSGFLSAATVPTPTTQAWGTSLVEKDSKGFGIGKVKLLDASGNTVPSTSNYSTSQTISGSNNGVSISVNGGAIASLHITGMTGGVIFPQVSNDGANFVSCYDEIRTYGTNASRISVISVSGAYTVNIAGWKYFRLSATSLTTPITAAINISGASNTGTLENLNDYASSVSASAASSAGYLAASPAGQPNDPVSTSVSPTASLFISITITSTVNGTKNHQILAAPGTGLRYRIKTYGMGVSGACTGGNTTALISLCSNGVTLQDTVYTPLLPTSVAVGPGGFTVPEVDKTHTFLVGGYNEPLCWKWITTAPMAGTSCIARLNLEYEIIQ